METVKRWTNIFETMNETAAARQEAGFGCSRADASILQHASSRNLQPSELVELRANRREGPYRLKGRKRQQRQHTPAPLRVGKRQGAGGAAPSCNHALFTRARQRQLYTRGKRSSAAGRTTRCGTEQQTRIYRVRASGDDHLTRPETLSGNAMWKKLTTTPWRTEDARSGLVSPRRFAHRWHERTPRR